MRLTDRHKGLRDNSAFKVSALHVNTRTRSNHMTDKSLETDRTRRIGEVPEQVHSGKVVLLIVCPREFLAESISHDFPVQLDMITVIACRAAVDAGHGNAKNMVAEPCIVRHGDLERIQIVFGNREIYIRIDVSKIQFCPAHRLAHVIERSRLLFDLLKCLLNINIIRILNDRIRIIRLNAPALRPVVDRTVNFPVHVKCTGSHVSSFPVADVRGIQGCIAECVVVFVRTADYNSTHNVATVGFRCKIIADKKRISAQDRRRIIIAIVAVPVRSCHYFIAREQTDDHHEREHNAD